MSHAWCGVVGYSWGLAQWDISWYIKPKHPNSHGIPWLVSCPGWFHASPSSFQFRPVDPSSMSFLEHLDSNNRHGDFSPIYDGTVTQTRWIRRSNILAQNCFEHSMDGTKILHQLIHTVGGLSIHVKIPWFSVVLITIPLRSQTSSSVKHSVALASKLPTWNVHKKKSPHGKFQSMSYCIFVSI